MRVTLYARVSTTRQAEKDLSIPDQINQMQEYCTRHGHTVVDEFLEMGASATDDNRPQFQLMTSRIISGDLKVDAILVLTTSRFFRDAVAAGVWKQKLKKKGVRVIAITQEVGDPSLPTSELLETIFAAIDQHESRMIGFHTLRGMKENVRKGYFNGSRPPFGYSVDRTHDQRGNPKNVLVVNEREAEIVRRIFSLYVNEDLGGIEITKRLNDEGLFRQATKKSVKPRRWVYQEVLRVLENTVYIGKYVFGRFDSRNKVVRPESEWIVVNVPPIVDEAIFEAAQAIRVKRHKEWKNGRAYVGPLHLVGVLRCSKCGAKMISSTAKGGRYVYYACGTFVRQSKNACSGHRVPAEEFQRQALKYVLDWAFSEENVLEVVKRVRAVLLLREDPARELREELKTVNERLQRYYDAFEAGTLDAEDLGVRIKTLKAKRVELEERLRAHVATPELPASYTTPENIARIRMAINAAFWNGSAQLKKQWLSFLVKDLILDGKTVTVTANGEGIMGCLDGCKDNAEPDVARVIRSIQKWRPQRDLNPCRRRERAVS